jgi:hypothetical protein
MSALEAQCVGWDRLEQDPGLLQPGDIVQTQSGSIFSFPVRVLTTGRWERLSWSSHSALVIPPDPAPRLIESVLRTRIRRILSWQRTKVKLIVHRRDPVLSTVEQDRVCAVAETHLGQWYGFGKIVCHALDGCLGGVFLFRRLICSDCHPICSWLVANAYAEGHTGVIFDPSPAAASPDDIMDYCVAHDWQLVWADSQPAVDSYNKTYQRRVARWQARGSRRR